MATINKVKLKPGLVEIHTDTIKGQDEQETIHKSTEDPHPDFVSAMNDAVKTVYTVLGLPGGLWAGQVRVTSVSFSCSEAGLRGVVITGQAAVDECDAPFCFNTPHMPFEPYTETSKAKTLSTTDRQRMEKILVCAADFLTGKRAQGQLPLQDGKAAAAGEPTDA